MLDVKDKLIGFYRKEMFSPSALIGIWINPFFIIRRGLYRGVLGIAAGITGGKLLDVGCGSKPYESLFRVDDYVGMDLGESGHSHAFSRIDVTYDGKEIPFGDGEFDVAFSSEVFEHVFNIDELLIEIHRVLKTGGKLAFTCPFAWNEHEIPYDFARYSSYGIASLIERHGFEIESLHKTTKFIPTLAQIMSLYVVTNILPKNRILRQLLIPIFVAPINIIGIMLGKVLPDDKSFYHNSVVIAHKK